MGIYVEAQTAINNRRMAELELQLKQQETQAALQQQQNISAIAPENLEGVGVTT